MKFWKLCSIVALGCGTIAMSALPSQAALNHSKTLKGDVDGDGRMESVVIAPEAGQYCKITVLNRNGRVMCSNSNVVTEGYNTYMLSDVDGDGCLDLVFGTSSGADVRYWKNGKYTDPTSYTIARSVGDTTKFYCYDEGMKNAQDATWIKQNFEAYHPAQYDEDGKEIPASKEPNVNLGNLRRVGNACWGDVTIDGTAKAQVRLDKLQLAHKKVLTIVEGKDSFADGKHPLSFVCVPKPVNTKVTTDLNGDGKTEVVTFNSYYPCSGSVEWYQIVVREGKDKVLWKSPRSTSKSISANSGVSIRPLNGKHSLTSTIITDIDKDGKLELIVSSWERGVDVIEIWRWQDGKFVYDQKTHLMRLAADPDKYVFAKDDVYKDERLDVKKVENKDGDEVKEYDSISNLRIINGALWGITGKFGQGTDNTKVKLEPGRHDIKVVERKPCNSCYWD